MEQENNIFNHLKARKGSAPNHSYFENLAKTIIAKEEKKAVIVPLYKKPVFWLIASAASVALLFILNTTQTKNTPSPLLALNEISKSEIVNYIDDNIEEFDNYLLSQYISEKLIEESKTEIIVATLSVDPEPIKELDKVELDDILDYFELEEIDIYELEDELYN